MSNSESTVVIEPGDLPQLRFGLGAGAIWRSIGYLFKHPALFKNVAPSFVVNCILVYLILWGLWSLMGLLDTHIIAWEAGAEGWIEGLATGVRWAYFVVKSVAVVLFVIFVLPPLYVIMMNLNPLTALLAERTFRYVIKAELGHELAGQQAGLAVGAGRAILVELRKLLVYALQMIGALCLNFIPVIGNVASAVVCYMVNAQTSGWGLITPYYEDLGYTYRNQKLAMRRQRKVIWGLGTMQELVLLIPVINIIGASVGHIAGALAAAESERLRRGPAAGDQGADG